MSTATRTHAHEDFANPHLVCVQCHQPVTGFHDQILCSCPKGYWLLPCRHTAEAVSLCPSWSPVDGCACTTPHATGRKESTVDHEWYDDGHTTDIVLAGGCLEARITCPRDGENFTGRALDELPACRVGRSTENYGHRFALDRCLLVATAEEFQQDELWQDSEDPLPITALPIALLWRDNGSGEVYIRPKADGPHGAPRRPVRTRPDTDRGPRGRDHGVPDCRLAAAR